MAKETISEICSYLSSRDFVRFQRTSQAYDQGELYNGKNYGLLQDEFECILKAKNCPNADEILANIVKRGGIIEFPISLCGYSDDSDDEDEEDEDYHQDLGRYMIRKSYFLLYDALLARKILVTDQFHLLLYISVDESVFEFCKLLLGIGAEQNFPISLLSIAENLDIATLLLDYGADMNFIDIRGSSVLEKLILNDSMDVFSFLVDRGACYNVVDEYGHSLLHILARNDHFSLYQKLVKLNVDSTLVDHEGQTAIDFVFDRYLVDDEWETEKALKGVLGLFDGFTSEQRLEHEPQIIQMLASLWEIKGW